MHDQTLGHTHGADHDTTSLQDARVSPFDRVPSEIMGKIFASCLENDCVDPLRLSAPHKPVTLPILSQVCRYWKDATLSHPTLWSSIQVYRPSLCHIPMVKLWLCRSRTCPLSLTIRQSYGAGPTEHDVTEEILHLFIEHVSRWKDIDFKFFGELQQSLLSIPEGAAGSLESATFYLYFFDPNDADEIWRIVHTSPSLCRVDWSFDYAKMPVHAPWERLTHIALGYATTADALLDVLQLCREIRVLDIFHLLPSPIPSHEPPPVVSNLHTLIIRGLDRGSEVSFKRFILPSMKSLEVHHSYPNLPYHLEAVPDLLARSSCNLEKLVLADQDIGEEGVLAYFKLPQVASLVELEIHHIVKNPTIISLTRRLVDGFEEFLLPRLQTIKLGPCYTSNGVVSAMIASRLTAPKASIRTVDLYLGSADAYDIEALKMTKGLGLKVNVYLYGEKIM